MFCRRPPARGLPRQCHQLRQPVGVFLMLRHHHADGVGHEGASASRQHRKEHAFFLGHVIQQFRVHLLQKHGQTPRHVRMIRMDGFHLGCQLDQFGQLLTVDLVEALQDVLDQRRRLGGFCLAGRAAGFGCAAFRETRLDPLDVLTMGLQHRLQVCACLRDIQPGSKASSFRTTQA